MNRKIPFQPIFSLMMLLLFSRQPKATESRSSQPPTHNLPPSPIRRKPHISSFGCVCEPHTVIMLCVPPVSYTCTYHLPQQLLVPTDDDSDMYLITLTDWLSSRIRSFQKLSGIGDIQKPTKKRRILSYTSHIVGQPENAPTKRNKQSLKGFTRLNNPREWVAATYISYRAFVIRLKEPPLSYTFITPPKIQKTPKSLCSSYSCVFTKYVFLFL